MEIILGTRDIFISLRWDLALSMVQNAFKAMREWRRKLAGKFYFLFLMFMRM